MLIWELLEEYIFQILALTLLVKVVLNREYYIHFEYIDKGLRFPLFDIGMSFWVFGNLFKVWWKEKSENRLTESLRTLANISNLMFLCALFFVLLVLIF